MDSAAISDHAEMPAGALTVSLGGNVSPGHESRTSIRYSRIVRSAGPGSPRLFISALLELMDAHGIDGLVVERSVVREARIPARMPPHPSAHGSTRRKSEGSTAAEDASGDTDGTGSTSESSGGV
jgi:hypothetical protein